MTPPQPDTRSLLDQRQAVIEFGRMALTSTDLDEILTEACELCRRTLGTEFSKVMRLEDEGRVLRVVAGVGWAEGVVGEEVVPAVPESSEGFPIVWDRSVVSRDVSEEDRFHYAGFLKRHGVEAIVNVVIPGADGEAPYGLLEVDSREPTDFTSSDVEFLQGYANIIGAAIVRFDRAEKLARALDAKGRALNELHHRVKNNLAVLNGMLRMRARHTPNQAVRLEIDHMAGHVESMSQLHALLGPNGGIDEVDAGDFLNSLCSQVCSFGSASDYVCELQSSVEVALVDSSVAIPLGLIANEFITNSIKHASRDGQCAVHLDVRTEADAVVVELRDEGDGMPVEDTQDPAEASGQGLTLIEGLATQIGAETDWSSANGTRLRIRAPRFPHRAGT